MTEGPRDPAVNLATYLETRLNLIREDIKALEKEWDERLRQMDLRYSQRFDAQQEAIGKSDKATDVRLESMNEFRKSLGDQANMLMPRAESQRIFEALNEKIRTLENRLNTRDGGSERQVDNRANIGVWVAIAAVLLSALAIYLK